MLDYCLTKPTNHKSYQNVKEYKTPKDTKGIYNLNKILFFYPSKTTTIELFILFYYTYTLKKKN